METIVTIAVILFFALLFYLISKFTPYNSYEDTAKDYGLYKYYYSNDNDNIEWVELREGIDKNGNKYTVTVFVRANKEDALAMARLVSNGKELSDKELLSSFINIHWGKVI